MTREPFSADPMTQDRQRTHIIHIDGDRVPTLVAGLDTLETLMPLFISVPKILSRAIVYMFVKGDKVLYVGSSQHGMSRPFSPTHDQKEARRLATKVLACPCKTITTARRLETRLIALFRPEYNGISSKRIRMVKAKGRRTFSKYDGTSLDKIQLIKSHNAWNMMVSIEENFDRWDRRMASQRSEAMPKG